MVYGQVVAVHYGWPVQNGRPVVRLGRRAPATITPGLEGLSRIAVGAAVGGAIGAATFHVVVWLLFGMAAALLFGRVRDGSRAADGSAK